MDKIIADAKANARKFAVDKFKDPADLDEISVITYQVQKHKMACEAQLNAAIQGKLDALKRAVDLMDQSDEKLSNFALNMKIIDERIEATNTQLCSYPNLKRIHYVRDNLQKVIAQIEFFAKVPDKVAALRRSLESEPHKLKDVYMEAVKLDSLRSALMKEIKVSRNRKQSIDANNFGDYSKDSSRRIKGIVEQHLHSIPDLIKQIRAIIFGNIDAMMDLAADAPEDLVTTFEVVEMHQEYLDRLESRTTGKRGKNGRDTDDEKPEINLLDDIAHVVQLKIRNSLSQKIEGIFDVMMNRPENAEKKISKTTSLLAAATQIVRNLTIFRSEVVPCTPPHYDVMGAFLDALEDSLSPLIQGLVNNISELSVGDIMQIIDWSEFYVQQLGSFDGEDSRQFCFKLSQIAEDLLHEYLQRIKNQVMSWFQNIQGLKIEIKEYDDKTLITSSPEDMFNVLHQQFSVAKEKLPKEFFKDVVNACLQTLREVQRQSYDRLSSTWHDLEPQVLCSIINDTQRMQDKADELSQTTVQDVLQADHRDMLQSMVEEVSSEYISIAINGVSFLARRVLEDFGDEVFSKLFIVDWESAEPLSLIIVATLEDFFSDIKVWLSEYFYCKFVREVLVRLVGFYIMTLRRHNPGSFKFRSELRAANKIIIDREYFLEFFSKYADVLRLGGMQDVPGHPEIDPIQHELSALDDLARVLSSSHISGAEESVLSLFTKYGYDGFKLVISAIHANPNMSKQEKTDYNEGTSKRFNKGVKEKAYSNKPSELYKDFANDAPAAEDQGRSKDGTVGGANAPKYTGPKFQKKSFFRWS